MPTAAQIQTRLDGYYEAETKILKSQEYQVGQGSTSRRNVRAELETVRQTIKELEAELATVQANTSGGRRQYTLVPR